MHAFYLNPTHCDPKYVLVQDCAPTSLHERLLFWALGGGRVPAARAGGAARAGRARAAHVTRFPLRTRRPSPRLAPHRGASARALFLPAGRGAARASPTPSLHSGPSSAGRS